MGARRMGRVIWITGLSGSGKTTLAQALQQELEHSILLDGDDLRQALGAENTGYDREGRKNLAKTYSCLALMLARQGFTVLVATISLFHEIHEWNRENLPNYLEIFLDIPDDIRRKRDPKGLYAKNIPDMAGERIAVDFPAKPDLILEESKSLKEAVKAVLHLFSG